MLEETDIALTKDEKSTIRLFEESIFWLGKYPAPKKFKHSDKKLRGVFKKVVKPSPFQVITSDPKRWPCKNNYTNIWAKLYQFYFKLPTDNPNEFGFILKQATQDSIESNSKPETC